MKVGAGAVFAGVASGVALYIGYKVVKSGAQTIEDVKGAAKEAVNTVVETAKKIPDAIIAAPAVIKDAGDAAVSSATGRDTNMGGESWEVINKIKGWLGLPSLGPDNTDPSTHSNTAAQGPTIAAMQDDFRAMEREYRQADDAATAAAAEQEKATAARRADFRLYEFADQSDYYGVGARSTDSGRLMNELAKMRVPM